MKCNVKTNWIDIINNEKTKSYWSFLENSVNEAYINHAVYPSKELIFACFNYFNWQDTKVVIIGQDPYYKPNQANGLSFSVNDNTPLPKSLINIFQELENDLGIKRTNGNLTDWACQGVLLLNNTLTVNDNQPNSHASFGWQNFTDHIISYLDQNVEGIIFVLLGNFAKSKKPLIQHGLIVETSHPSPLSAYQGFFGSKIFSKINNLLILRKMPVIRW
jgi:uracil-DNA glycosylase